MKNQSGKNETAAKRKAAERTVGENISYGSDGVFTVVDIRTERIAGVPTDYYVLKRYGDIGASLVYVPKGNEKLVAAMHDLMREEEAKVLLEKAGSIAPAAVSEDPRDRADDYKKLIEGSHEDRVALIKAAEGRMEKRRAEGKKPYLNDETAQKKAEKLLYAELSAVLGLTEEEIRKTVLSKED